MGNSIKRFLALMLAVVMVVGMMPTNMVFAAEGEDTVYTVYFNPNGEDDEGLTFTPETCCQDPVIQMTEDESGLWTITLTYVDNGEDCTHTPYILISNSKGHRLVFNQTLEDGKTYTACWHPSTYNETFPATCTEPGTYIWKCNYCWKEETGNTDEPPHCLYDVDGVCTRCGATTETKTVYVYEEFGRNNFLMCAYIDNNYNWACTEVIPMTELGNGYFSCQIPAELNCVKFGFRDDYLNYFGDYSDTVNCLQDASFYGATTGSYYEPVDVIDTYEELAAALDEGGTVVLGGDINGTYYFNHFLSNVDVTLDLNGHTITSTDFGFSITVNETAKLTVCDSVGGGGIAARQKTYFYARGGEVVINGGRFEPTEVGEPLVSVGDGKYDDTAELTINGGEFIYAGTLVHSFKGKKITINGGEFTATGDRAFNVRSWTVDWEITGGEFTCENGNIIYNDYADGTEVSISGGDFTAKELLKHPNRSNIVTNIAITGGNFAGVTNADQVKGFVANGYELDANGTVVKKEDENAINTEEKLQAALNNGGEIKLAGNITVENGLTIPKGVVVILDMNGFKISQKKAQTAAYSMIVNIGKLTITNEILTPEAGWIEYTDATNYTSDVNYVSNTIQNNGELIIQGAVTIFNWSNPSVANYGYPHCIDTNGKLTVDSEQAAINNTSGYSAIRIWCTTDDDTSVTIKAGNLYGAIDLHNVNANANKGTLVIEGGNFNGVNGKPAVRLLDFGGDIDELTIDISGGTFAGDIVHRDYANKGATPEIEITGGTYDADVSKYVAEGYALVNGTVVEAPVGTDFAAMIGTKGYETLAEAIAAVQNGETIVLVDDCAENVTIKQVSGKSFTIDGADKTYTGTITVDGNKRVNGKETLTIQNVNFVAAGKWQSSIETVRSSQAHNITVDDCTFTGNDAKQAYGILLSNAHNITVTNTTGTKLYDLIYGKYAVNGLTVENVVVTESQMGIMAPYGENMSFKNVHIEAEGAGVGIYNNASSTATFENCTIKAHPAVWLEQKHATNTYTLIFNGTNDLSNTGSEQIKVVGSAAKLKVINNGTGLDLTQTTGLVAMVGGTGYNTFAEAYAAAQAGDTIVMLGGYTATEPIVIDKNLTLDVNGKTIAGENVYPVIRVQGDAAVTVKNGTIKNDNDYVFVLGASDGSSAGYLTIESGSYTGATTVASVTKGELSVTGGEFEATGEYGATYLLNCVDANYAGGSAKIVVTGGSFKGFNPADNAAEGAGTDFVLDGYKVVANGDVYTVSEIIAAMIGDVKYDTLADAIAAVKNGETIVLMDNCAENVTIKQTKGLSFTIEGNGMTYTGTITVDGNRRNTGAETLTIQNVNFVAAKSEQVFITAKEGTYVHKVTVDGCTFTGTDKSQVGVDLRHTYDITVQNSSGTLLKQLVYSPKAITGFVAENVIVTESAYGIVLGYVIDAKISNANLDVDATGVYINNYTSSTSTVTGCTINAKTPVLLEQKNGNAYTLIVDGQNNLTSTNDGALIAVTGDNASLNVVLNGEGVKGEDISGLVAQVGNICYNRFDEAWAALEASEDKTITLFETYVIDNGPKTFKDITIKGKGAEPAIRIAGNVFVAMDNVTMETDDYAFILGASDGSSAGNLHIYGGTFKSTTSVASVTKGELVIAGGEFSVDPYNGSYDYLINCIDANYKNGTAVVKINGGEFHNWNPADNAAEGAGTNFLAEDYRSYELEENVWSVMKKQAAKIGETYYATLADAIAAVKNGETIELLEDCAENVTIKQTKGLSFTIEGNGKTYTGTITVDGSRRSTGKETLTIQNVNFVAAKSEQVFITAKENTYVHNLIVDGCSFTGTDKSQVGVDLRHTYDITVQNSTGTLLKQLVYSPKAITGFVAENVTVTESAYGIALGYVVDAYITNANLDVDATGVYINNYTSSTTTVTDCTINAKTPVMLEQKSATTAYTLIVDGQNNLTSTNGGALINVIGEDAKLKVVMNDSSLNELDTIGLEARIDNVYYNTFKNALAAVKTDEVITVLKTVELTADLNLKGITVEAGKSVNTAPVFRVLGDVTVTNGTVDGTTGINSYAFIVGNSTTEGTLTIADGNYKGVTSAISITNGIANISGGIFAAGHDDEGTDYGAQYLLNCMDAAYVAGNAKYNITGGSFVDFNPMDNAAEGEGTNFVAEGYHATDADEDGTYIVEKHSHGSEWVMDEDYHWHECTCGDKTDFAEHAYVNGVCSDCGKSGIIEAPEIEFMTISLSFQEYIGLQFIAKQSMFDGYDSHYAVIVQQKPNADKGAVTGYVEDRIELVGTPSGTAKNPTYVFNRNIQAWSMTDVVTITLYAVKDGVTYKGETRTTSVMEQAYLKLGQFAGNAGYAQHCKILADMLTYGAAVQTAFDHDAQDLPDAKLEELGYSSFVTTTIPELTAENTVEGSGSVTVRSTSLSLQEKVDLQLIFKDVMTGYKAVVTLADGEPFEVYPDGNMKKFSLVALPYKMRETYTVVICDAETGAAVSPTYTYSIESVAKTKLGNTAAFDALVYAMMNYGDSVKAIVK